jgi:hypothetical protein
MSIQNDIIELNTNIEGWDKKNLRDLKSELNRLGVRHRRNSPNKVALVRVLKSRLRKRSGLTDRISYVMPRSAVFLHKGVSKGHPITNPRQAKPWYVPVVDGNMDALGDIVSEGGGNLIINNLSIR